MIELHNHTLRIVQTQPVPAMIDGHPVRYVTIDEDGAVMAWAAGDAEPEYCDGFGAWTCDTANMQQIGTAPACPSAATAIYRVQ